MSTASGAPAPAGWRSRNASAAARSAGAKRSYSSRLTSMAVIGAAGASTSAVDHSSHTPISPSSRSGYWGVQPAAWARAGSTITAGISPGLAGPCVNSTSAPDTRLTASMTSSTDSELPDPITVEPAHFVRGQAQPHGGHHVVGVHVVAHLRAVAVDLERRAQADAAHQPGDDAVLGLHAGTVDVGQADARAAQPVGRGVGGHQHLARGLGRAVGGERTQLGVLGDLRLLHRPRDRVGGGEGQRRHAGGAARLEQRVGAGNVGGERSGRAPPGTSAPR